MMFFAVLKVRAAQKKSPEDHLASMTQNELSNKSAESALLRSSVASEASTEAVEVEVRMIYTQTRKA
jgi:hypothetical protein